MNTLIVYDSVFGNTQAVAESIASSLDGKAIVVMKNVTDVALSDVLDADRVIFGSPTRAFSPTPAMRKFLSSLPNKSLMGKQIDLFDTRMDFERVDIKLLKVLVKIFGYAADSMARIVKKKGASVIRTDWYYVEDSEGPLPETEKDRAGVWAVG